MALFFHPRYSPPTSHRDNLRWVERLCRIHQLPLAFTIHPLICLDRVIIAAKIDVKMYEFEPVFGNLDKIKNASKNCLAV